MIFFSEIIVESVVSNYYCIFLFCGNLTSKAKSFSDNLTWVENAAYKNIYKILN